MQVNVFVTRVNGALRNSLLVLPVSPAAAIPPEMREGWTYYATTNSDDAMFRSASIEDDIALQGYCLVETVTPRHV